MGGLKGVLILLLINWLIPRQGTATINEFGQVMKKEDLGNGTNNNMQELENGAEKKMNESAYELNKREKLKIETGVTQAEEEKNFKQKDLTSREEDFKTEKAVKRNKNKNKKKISLKNHGDVVHHNHAEKKMNKSKHEQKKRGNLKIETGVALAKEKISRQKDLTSSSEEDLKTEKVVKRNKNKDKKKISLKKQGHFEHHKHAKEMINKSEYEQKKRLNLKIESGVAQAEEWKNFEQSDLTPCEEDFKTEKAVKRNKNKDKKKISLKKHGRFVHHKHTEEKMNKSEYEQKKRGNLKIEAGVAQAEEWKNFEQSDLTPCEEDFKTEKAVKRNKNKDKKKISLKKHGRFVHHKHTEEKMNKSEYEQKKRGNLKIETGVAHAKEENNFKQKDLSSSSEKDFKTEKVVKRNKNKDKKKISLRKHGHVVHHKHAKEMINKSEYEKKERENLKIEAGVAQAEEWKNFEQSDLTPCEEDFKTEKAVKRNKNKDKKKISLKKHGRFVHHKHTEEKMNKSEYEQKKRGNLKIEAGVAQAEEWKNFEQSDLTPCEEDFKTEKAVKRNKNKDKKKISLKKHGRFVHHKHTEEKMNKSEYEQKKRGNLKIEAGVAQAEEWKNFEQSDLTPCEEDFKTEKAVKRNKNKDKKKISLKKHGRFVHHKHTEEKMNKSEYEQKKRGNLKIETGVAHAKEENNFKQKDLSSSSEKDFKTEKVVKRNKNKDKKKISLRKHGHVVHHKHAKEMINKSEYEKKERENLKIEAGVAQAEEWKNFEQSDLTPCEEDFKTEKAVKRNKNKDKKKISLKKHGRFVHHKHTEEKMNKSEYEQKKRGNLKIEARVAQAEEWKNFEQSDLTPCEEDFKTEKAVKRNKNKDKKKISLKKHGRFVHHKHTEEKMNKSEYKQKKRGNLKIETGVAHAKEENNFKQKDLSSSSEKDFKTEKVVKRNKNKDKKKISLKKHGHVVHLKHTEEMMNKSEYEEKKRENLKMETGIIHEDEEKNFQQKDLISCEEDFKTEKAVKRNKSKDKKKISLKKHGHVVHHKHTEEKMNKSEHEQKKNGNLKVETLVAQAEEKNFRQKDLTSSSEKDLKTEKVVKRNKNKEEKKISLRKHGHVVHHKHAKEMINKSEYEKKERENLKIKAGVAQAEEWKNFEQSDLTPCEEDFKTEEAVKRNRNKDKKKISLKKHGRFVHHKHTEEKMSKSEYEQKKRGNLKIETGVAHAKEENNFKQKDLSSSSEKDFKTEKVVKRNKNKDKKKISLKKHGHVVHLKHTEEMMNKSEYEEKKRENLKIETGIIHEDEEKNFQQKDLISCEEDFKTEKAVKRNKSKDKKKISLKKHGHVVHHKHTEEKMNKSEHEQKKNGNLKIETLVAQAEEKNFRQKDLTSSSEKDLKTEKVVKRNKNKDKKKISLKKHGHVVRHNHAKEMINKSEYEQKKRENLKVEAGVTQAEEGKNFQQKDLTSCEEDFKTEKVVKRNKNKNKNKKKISLKKHGHVVHHKHTDEKMNKSEYEQKKRGNLKIETGVIHTDEKKNFQQKDLTSCEEDFKTEKAVKRNKDKKQISLKKHGHLVHHKNKKSKQKSKHAKYGKKATKYTVVYKEIMNRKDLEKMMNTSRKDKKQIQILRQQESCIIESLKSFTFLKPYLNTTPVAVESSCFYVPSGCWSNNDCPSSKTCCFIGCSYVCFPCKDSFAKKLQSVEGVKAVDKKFKTKSVIERKLEIKIMDKFRVITPATKMVTAKKANTYFSNCIALTPATLYKKSIIICENDTKEIKMKTDKLETFVQNLGEEKFYGALKYANKPKVGTRKINVIHRNNESNLNGYMLIAIIVLLAAFLAVVLYVIYIYKDNVQGSLVDAHPDGDMREKEDIAIFLV